MPLIRFHKISRRYQMGAETIHALRDVSLEIQRGDVLLMLSAKLFTASGQVIADSGRAATGNGRDCRPKSRRRSSWCCRITTRPIPASTTPPNS